MLRRLTWNAGTFGTEPTLCTYWAQTTSLGRGAAGSGRVQEPAEEIPGLGETHQKKASTRVAKLTAALADTVTQIEALNTRVEAKKARLQFIDDVLATADDYCQQVDMIETGMASAEELASSPLPTIEAKKGGRFSKRPKGRKDIDTYP